MLLCVAGRPAQGQVAILSGCVDLHFVEIEAALGRQLHSHVARRPPVQRHYQRLPVGKAVKQAAVVLVGELKVLAVGGEPDHELHAARRRAVEAIKEHDAIDRPGRAQVDLPPGIRLLVGMEAPVAILDAVAAAAGVGLRRDLLANDRPAGPQHLLAEPIRFNLPGGNCLRVMGFSPGSDRMAVDPRERKNRSPQGHRRNGS